jgi:hypothetical protein
MAGVGELDVLVSRAAGRSLVRCVGSEASYAAGGGAGTADRAVVG